MDRYKQKKRSCKTVREENNRERRGVDRYKIQREKERKFNLKKPQRECVAKEWGREIDIERERQIDRKRGKGRREKTYYSC